LFPQVGQVGECDGFTRRLRKLKIFRQRGQANS
jgi:hypothetical protein